MNTTLFVYCEAPAGFSGQTAATELIVQSLKERGIPVQTLHLPAIDRTSNRRRLRVYLVYILRLLCCWLKIPGIRFYKPDAIHLTLGQTSVALLRDGLSLFFISLFCGKNLRKAVALHGSLFLNWEKTSKKARLFRWVTRNCHYLTCLGERHREALVGLGIPRQKIRIVYNACEYDGIDPQALLTKHRDTPPVEILFLSSLIDTKGFPEYLEALELLSTREGVPLRAVLCGPITITPYSERFRTQTEAQQWIESKIRSINRSSRVDVKWIPGSQGEAKARLYERAHIFVLPTRYKVEAQPLSVLEAMSWGATVITSTVGELPSTVDDKCAITLPNPSMEAIAESIERLATEPDLRRDLAVAGLERFHERFDRKIYTKVWMDLLDIAEK